MESTLRLRPVRIEDEAAALSGHAAMQADGFTFLLSYDSAMAWAGYVQLLQDQLCGKNVREGWVPSTFLFAIVDGAIVGRVDIRHSLNAFLAKFGGHIGYGVLPQFRKRGYAKEMLRQALIVARSLGIDRVLVTCDDDNVASARTIERCGGVLESTVLNEADEVYKRRYWID